MPLPPRVLPAGFIEPCLPTNSPQPPIGTAWVHEIKHDGIRVIARKTERGVRLYSRPGNDLTRRFPLIADALARLRARSCILDGETAFDTSATTTPSSSTPSTSLNSTAMTCAGSL